MEQNNRDTVKELSCNYFSPWYYHIPFILLICNLAHSVDPTLCKSTAKAEIVRHGMLWGCVQKQLHSSNKIAMLL